MIALLAVGCGAAAWWGVSDPKHGLVVAMAGLACSPFVFRAIQRRWDPFEPVNLLAIAILILFVGRPLVELKEHLQQYPPYDASQGFIPAMLIGMVGVAVMYGAYFSPAGARLAGRFRPLAGSWDAARSVRLTAGMLILGLLLGLLFAGTIGVHNYVNLYLGRGAVSGKSSWLASNGYFEFGPYVAIPGTFIALIAWRRRRSVGTAVLLTVCIAISLMLTVPRGDRTFILAFILPIGVMWYLGKRRRPRAITLIALLGVFMILANVSQQLRNVGSSARQAGVGTTIVRAITHPGHEIASFMRGADPSEFSVLEIEAHEYQLGALHFWPGSTLVSVATGWIPHQILRNKPWSPLQHVTWTLFPKTTGLGSYGPPVFGSMYADYGWLTLIVYSALLGIALRALWEYFTRHAENPGMQLFYSGAMPLVIIMFRDDIISLFAISVFLALPLIVCIKVCSRPPKRLHLPRLRVRPA